MPFLFIGFLMVGIALTLGNDPGKPVSAVNGMLPVKVVQTHCYDVTAPDQAAGLIVIQTRCK